MANFEGPNRLHSGISAEILPSPAEGIQHAPVDILSSSAEGIQHVSPVFPRISIDKGTQRVSCAPRTSNIQHVQRQTNSHIHLGHTSRSLGLFCLFLC